MDSANSYRARTDTLISKIIWRSLHPVRDDRVYHEMITSAIDLLEEPGENEDSDLARACLALQVAIHVTRDRHQSICERLHAINLIGARSDLIIFEIIRCNYKYEFYRSVAKAGGKELLVVLQDYQALQQRPGLEWSRYHREFEEVSFLAGGGFGKVFRSRNKLDDTVYAVKKVPFSCNIKDVPVQIAEVKTLASLNHINIVPYKAAWLEPLLSTGKSSNGTNGSSAIDIGDEQDDDVGQLAKLFHLMKLESSDSLRRSEAVSAGDENRKQELKREDPPGVIVDANPHLTLKWATLYIQMPLCHLTLREWLDERNASEDFGQFYAKFQRQGPVHHLDVVLDVFQQLLNGLNYIHSRGIVHHDIKPGNIFVSRSDHDSAITIQLGDFGLARSRGSSHAGVGFGTPFYAAPEQRKGTSRSDTKSDIYSLGLVLLELLVPLSIGMERADMINQIYRGQYPPYLNPDFSALIKNMLQQQPSRRPETVYLVEAVKRIRIYRDNVIAGQRQSQSPEKTKKQEVIDMSF